MEREAHVDRAQKALHTLIQQPDQPGDGRPGILVAHRPAASNLRRDDAALVAMRIAKGRRRAREVHLGHLAKRGAREPDLAHAQTRSGREGDDSNLFARDELREGVPAHPYAEGVEVDLGRLAKRGARGPGCIGVRDRDVSYRATTRGAR